MTYTHDTQSPNITVQSQYVNPTRQINYISEFKKILVGRNNQTVTQKFKIDNRISQYYYFQIVNRNNQIVQIDDDYIYEFFGSFVDARNQMHVVFFSDDFTITLDNQLRFKVNTFTSEYLYNIKRPKQIEITIKKRDSSRNIEKVILRDSGIAYPCPAQPEVEPTPVVAGWGLNLNGYVLSLDRQIPGSLSIGYYNELYVESETGEDGETKPTIAIGNHLDATTPQQVVVGHYNEPVSTATFIIGDGNQYNRHNALVVGWDDGNISGGTFYSNGARLATIDEVPTSTSQLTNDSDYVVSSTLNNYATTGALDAVSTAIPSSITQLDGTTNLIRAIHDQNSISAIFWNSDPEGGCTWKVGVDYNSLHNAGFAYTSAIPTSTSQLTNDSDFVVSSTLNNYATTGALDTVSAAIPTSTSQLTNDSGYITNSALSDYATTGALDTVSAAIPLSTSQLFNNTQNKIRYYHDGTVHDSGWSLPIDPTIDVYATDIRCNASGAIIIDPMLLYPIGRNQGVVIEQWIAPLSTYLDTTTYPDAVLHFEIQSEYGDITLIGDLPQTVEVGKVYAFVRRAINEQNNVTFEQISFTSVVR